MKIRHAIIVGFAAALINVVSAHQAMVEEIMEPDLFIDELQADPEYVIDT
jgi:hypothetical protein